MLSRRSTDSPNQHKAYLWSNICRRGQAHTAHQVVRVYRPSDTVPYSAAVNGHAPPRADQCAGSHSRGQTLESVPAALPAAGTLTV